LTVTDAALELRACPSCGRDLPVGAVVCQECHALVYARQLEMMAAQARTLEAERRPAEARAVWLQAANLLPAGSTQLGWVRDQARALEINANTMDLQTAEPSRMWAMLSPKSLGTLVAFLVVYAAIFGVKFGAGFAVMIAIHEMGHYIDIRRRGLPADMPVFLPGLGAYVRWRGMGVSAVTRAQISLAGPLAGLLAAVGCYALWKGTSLPIWGGLARAGAFLNALNLIPVAILDGGQAAFALGRVQRALLMAIAVATGIYFHESIFYLVGAGAGYRLFTKDDAAQPSLGVLAYYAVVLIALGAVMRAVPGTGFWAAPS
jgi:Zn-dependent protease